MQGWQSTYLGAREVPRELSSFELQTFFTYSRAERVTFHRLSAWANSVRCATIRERSINGTWFGMTPIHRT